MPRTPAMARLLIALDALAFACIPVAHAQLYAKEAPPGSAFIQVFNGTATAGINVQIGGRSQPPLLPYTASPYIFLRPAIYAVEAGSHKQTFALHADHYYTVAATADGLRFFDLHEPPSMFKAALVLFNLVPGVPLTLKTADGATPIFDAVARDESARRSINPLTLNLALFSGDRKIATAPPISLQRGQSFSLFASGSEVTPVLVWSKD